MSSKLSYSELEAKYNQLLVQNQSQRLLIDSDVIMVQIDTRGIVQLANRKACEILGYSEEEIVGKNWFDHFLPSHVLDEIKPISKKMLEGELIGAEYFENAILTKSGEERIISWHNTIIKSPEGNVLGHLSSGEDITERKKIEAKLELTNQIIERSPVIAVVWKNQKDWPIEFITENVKDILGYSPSEFTQNKVYYRDIIHPDDIARVESEVNAKENKSKYSFEHQPYRLKTKSGRYIWIKDTTYIKRGANDETTHFEGVLIDISESKNIELTLASQYARQNTIFEGFNDGLYLCDKEYTMLYMNPAMVELVGHDAKGEKCYKALYNNDLPCENCYFSDLKKTGEIEIEVAYGNRMFNVRSLLLENDERITIYSDITKFNEIKEALKVQNKELLVAKEAAEESNALKTEFMNNMSHEIRTPLNGILGFTDFLLDPDLEEKTRRYYVSIIKNSGNQLLRIIEDILEISELGTHQAILHLNKICVNDLLLALFSKMDQRAKENKTPLYMHKALPDSECMLNIDQDRLRKVLTNLLENALKFTSNGFVEFGYNVSQNKLVFYVKDTGIGISPEDQEVIFERFTQAEKGLSKKSGGLGLGLSIVKENVSLMNGSIRVDSALGKGSTFYITLPFKPIKETQKNKASRAAGNEKHTSINILIAEDEEVNFLYVEILLQEYMDANYTLHHARNGQEAVDFFESNQPVDLVLMDLKMPIMNGYEATTLIRNKHKKIPIIAQTAYSTDEDTQRALNAGCNDFIVKPIEKLAFAEIINKYLLPKKA